MSLQAVKERQPAIWQVFPVIETVTVGGFDGARIVVTPSDNRCVVLTSSGSYSTNAMIGVSLGGTYFVGAIDYAPGFVESILKADAAAPEAGFSNVVDMLDWLNRE